MNNLAIIPCRSGSKGIKDKNIKLLSGKALLSYSIDAALKSELFSEVMVSTDSKKYAKIAQEYGAEVPFLRSEKTSSDMAGSWEVVMEVLEQYQKQEKMFDTICLLQPTSPLREALDIKAAYRELLEREADAITSVCEVDYSPLWTMTLDDDLSLTKFRKSIKAVPRQMMRTYFRINGAIYIRRIEYIKQEIKICDKSEYAYIMDKSKSVDIDTNEDFEYASFLFEKKRLKSLV